MNKQREIIYSLRGSIVRSENVRDKVYDLIHDVIINNAEKLLDKNEEDSAQAFSEWILTMFPLVVNADEIRKLEYDPEKVAEAMYSRVQKAYDLKISFEDSKAVLMMERQIMLATIDNHWQEYLRSMDSLRHGVGLRAYGQRDPLVEYKREAFTMFDELMTTIKNEIASSLFRTTTSVNTYQNFMQSLPKLMLRHDEVSTLGSGRGPDSAEEAHSDDSGAAARKPSPSLPLTREEPKIGRNDPCICGSGKKYKKCCGK
jgi:preprotein translocase subunit SecA